MNRCTERGLHYKSNACSRRLLCCTLWSATQYLCLLIRCCGCYPWLSIVAPDRPMMESRLRYRFISLRSEPPFAMIILYCRRLRFRRMFPGVSSRVASWAHVASFSVFNDPRTVCSVLYVQIHSSSIIHSAILCVYILEDNFQYSPCSLMQSVQAGVTAVGGRSSKVLSSLAALIAILAAVAAEPGLPMSRLRLAACDASSNHDDDGLKRRSSADFDLI